MNSEIQGKADLLAYDQDLDASHAGWGNRTASMNLEHALSVVRDVFASFGGAQLRIFVKGQPRRLCSHAQEQIYLISREAMVNAVRHFEATQVEAEVEYLRSRLRVVIRDNGRGIDPDLVRSGKANHWGLAEMLERAEAIGAKLRVWSKPGAGTEVEITVPKDLRDIAACACA